MIVAARAVYRKRLEGVEGGGDHVVQFVHARGHRHQLIFVEHGRDLVPRAGDEESGGCHHLRIGGLDEVTGDLLANELRVRLVAIERVDHIVAISPRMEALEVMLAAVGLAEAHDIQPVPAPALAVSRRGQEPVDRGFVRFAISGGIGG